MPPDVSARLKLGSEGSWQVGVTVFLMGTHELGGRGCTLVSSGLGFGRNQSPSECGPRSFEIRRLPWSLSPGFDSVFGDQPSNSQPVSLPPLFLEISIEKKNLPVIGPGTLDLVSQCNPVEDGFLVSRHARQEPPKKLGCNFITHHFPPIAEVSALSVYDSTGTPGLCPTLSRSCGPIIQTLRRSRTNCTFMKSYGSLEISSARFYMVRARNQTYTPICLCSLYLSELP